MEQRNRRLVGALVVALAVIGLLGLSQYLRAENYRLAMEADYQRSFYEMVGNVENLEAALGKAVVANSRGQNVNFLTEAGRQAYTAQAQMSQLPLDQASMNRSGKFLNQVGDYCLSLARRELTTQPVSPEERQTLKELMNQVQALSVELQGIEQKVTTGQVRWTGDHKVALTAMGQGTPKALLDGFGAIDTRLQEYPTLVYDGPFSDHMERPQRQPQGREVTQSEAVKAAQTFLAPAGQRLSYRLTVQGNSQGTIPSYVIRATAAAAGDGTPGPAPVNLQVARRGGGVVWMLVEREAVGQAKISAASARQKAMAFLKERGFVNMMVTGSQVQNGEIIVSLAPRDGEVVIYPDLVKVRVALDDGRVSGFEAQGYLLSHRSRQLPRPKLSLTEARQKISQNLEIKRERLALIPTEGGGEVLTYEFLGDSDVGQYLVYINAANGREERIMQVVTTTGGSLTI